VDSDPVIKEESESVLKPETSRTFEKLLGNFCEFFTLYGAGEGRECMTEVACE